MSGNWIRIGLGKFQFVEMRKAYNEMEQRAADALEEAYKQIIPYQESLNGPNHAEVRTHKNIQPLTKNRDLWPGVEKSKFIRPTVFDWQPTLANVAWVKRNNHCHPSSTGRNNQPH